MSGFGANPTTGTQGSLPTNQFPLSSVAVPGTANGDLTALEGGPASTDSNGNKTAPASMYVKDGADVNQGLTTDAAVTTDANGTVSAKLRGLVKISGDIWDSTNHRIRVDGSGVTQPVSAASLPLPSGAATSAKQPALGTAGTASSDVLTVQGIASMTPLKTDGSGVTQPVSGTVTANIGTTNGLALDSSVSGVLVSQGSTTSGEKGPLVQGAVTTAAPTYTTAQTSPISLTTAGAVRVDGSAATQPVSGTVSAAQSGTWNITNVSGTVSLPTGAATAAKQPALGTAGSASSDVLSVQGIASMTALKTDGSGVTQPVSGTFWQATQPVSGTITANIGTTNGLALDSSVNGVLVSQGSTTSGEKGPLVQGAVTTAAPTYTTAQTSPISLTTAGAVRVDGSGVTQPVSGTFWQATQPVSGTVSITANSAVNVAQVAGTTTDTNSGNKSAGTQRVVLATDQPALTNALKVDGSTVTQPVSGTVTANAGTGTLNVSQQATGSTSATLQSAQTGNANGTSLTVLGMATVVFTVTVSTFTGTVNFEGTEDNSNWSPLLCVPAGGTTTVTTATAAGQWTASCAGLQSVRARTSGVSGGNVTVTGHAVPVSAANLASGSGGSGGTSSSFGSAFPGTGTAIGASDGTNMQGLLVESSSNKNLRVALYNGSTEASVTGSNALKVDGSAVTQPISAASLPLPTGAATSAKQPALGTAGSASADVITVQGIASMTALKVDGSAVTQPVSGTFWQATQPVSGTVTANQGGSNWSVNVAQVAGGNASNAGQTGAMQVGGAVATNTVVSSATNPLLIAGSDYGGTPKVQSLKVDSSGNAQVAVTNTPTVTANAGTNLNTSALALDTSVNGVLLSQGSTTSGQKGPLVQGAVTTNAPSYTTAQTSPLSLDASGLLRASLKDTPSNTNNLNVNLAASAATVTVSGTVTANAGTNLNTSALALETGGNLATLAGAVTSAKIQTNTAQINGVAPTMGNGVSGTGVQRVTIASDSTGQVALAAGANTIGAVTQASGPWTNNVTQFGGNNVATGTGAGGTGIPRVTVSNDSQLQLWDGTNGPVAVKAAGTAPALIDKAMVHSLSPNNTGLPVNLPTIVQSTNNKSSGSVASLAKAFVSNNVAGNSIIVVCAVGNGTAPTVTDSNNTYTQAAQIANSTTLNVAVFYAVNIASGANTVTVNNGGTTASIAMEIYEVSGLITQIQAQPDQTATNTGSSGTASTSAISTSSPNELAFAGIGIGTAAQTITAGSGWTNDSGQQNPTTPAGLFSFISMSQFLGSLKAVTPQATFTSEPWAIAVATFRPVVLGVEGTTKITDGTTTMGFGQNTMANSLPVAIASNQGAVAIGVASGTALTADQSNTILKTSLYVKKSANADTVLALGSATSANSVPVVIASDQAAVPASQSGTWTEVPNAATSGGSTPSHTISASGTNSTSLKGSAGQVYGFSISNSNAAARFFKLYNKAAAPTIVTDTPVMTVQIPANGTVIRAFPVGLAFATGIGWGLTTGIADNDTGSVGTDISVDIDYK